MFRAKSYARLSIQATHARLTGKSELHSAIRISVTLITSTGRRSPYVSVVTRRTFARRTDPGAYDADRNNPALPDRPEQPRPVDRAEAGGSLWRGVCPPCPGALICAGGGMEPPGSRNQR